MIKSDIETAQIKREVNVGEGRRLVLIDRLAMQDALGKLECARNVYLLNTVGSIIWQIHTEFDEEGVPFTGLSCQDGSIKVYRWDGGMYSVDITSGFAVPEVLAR